MKTFYFDLHEEEKVLKKCWKILSNSINILKT